MAWRKVARTGASLVVMLAARMVVLWDEKKV
jgi:hypothetical protein